MHTHYKNNHFIASCTSHWLPYPKITYHKHTHKHTHIQLLNDIHRRTHLQTSSTTTGMHCHSLSYVIAYVRLLPYYLGCLTALCTLHSTNSFEYTHNQNIYQYLYKDIVSNILVFVGRKISYFALQTDRCKCRSFKQLCFEIITVYKTYCHDRQNISSLSLLTDFCDTQ